MGLLRGDETIQYKSPYSGIITLYQKSVGDVEKNKKLFDLKNYEYSAKIEILKIKINRLRKKGYNLTDSYNSAKMAYEAGFISLRELQGKNDEVNENEISIKELTTELESLENQLSFGNVRVDGKFIIRDVFVSDKQNVNAGDNIIKIETLNRYHVDIKYDPISINGRIQDKNIKYRSLIDGKTGTGKVVKVMNANNDINSVTHGLKIASVVIHNSDTDISYLLDTAFEIIIDD